MKIGITGAGGLIGRRVAALARERGHEVFAIPRDPAPMPDLRGCEAIVNLAGESIVGLWTKEKMREIRESRILSTRRIVEAIAKLPSPPGVLVSGSAIGYYGETGDTETAEDGASGGTFLAGVCRDWESEARQAGKYGVRVVALRTGIVLAREGGALAAMLPAFRLGLGGNLGSGRQWVSWIHIEDEAALILHALENAALSGPLNATAPVPVRNAELTRALAAKLNRPAFFHAPAFALRLLAGRLSEELLGSRRVLPRAAEAAGIAFRFSTLDAALEELLK